MMAADQGRRHLSRRRFVQGAGVVGLGLLAGCGRLPGQAAPLQRLPRIGLLVPGPQAQFTSRTEAFRQGLRQFGYVDGENAVVEYRYAEHGVDSLPILAQELVQLQPEVIVTSGPSARAASQATTTIPIVFAGVTDPVGTGLISSLARPGGNLTGITNFAEQIDTKRLELLRETVPAITRVAHLWDPATPRSPIEATAQALGLQLQTLEARTSADLEHAFAQAVAAHAEALVASPTPAFISHQRRILDFAASHRLPDVYVSRDFAQAGGLMAYGQNNHENWRRAAYFVDRILKGAKSADLPVEQPREFEFVLNLRTAHALGLTIPQHVLLQATEIIQ
jgi:putative ABC transport system substrate-binding protein